MKCALKGFVSGFGCPWGLVYRIFSFGRVFSVDFHILLALLDVCW
jgi:hypothetical protein